MTGQPVTNSPPYSHPILSSYFSKNRHNFSHLVDSNPPILPDGLLNKEGGHPNEEEHEEVGHKESAAAIAVGHVGEAPDVAQPHGHAQACEEEVALVAPRLALARGHPFAESGLTDSIFIEEPSITYVRITFWTF